MRLTVDRILVLLPWRPGWVGVAGAACRAGEVGVLDVGGAWAISPGEARARRDAERGAGDCGLRVELDAAASLDGLRGDAPLPLLILAGALGPDVGQTVRCARRVARTVLCEVLSVEEAHAAADGGADGLLVKGHEAGGWVGALSSFIFLQRLSGALSVPYWIQGGIGLHSAAAARLAGAGIALREQIWLAEDAEAPEADRKRWHPLDGSETALLGGGHRVYRCFERTARQRRREIQRAASSGADWVDQVRRAEGEGDDPLVPLGQEISFAARLARDHKTVGGILAAYRASIEHVALAAAQRALGPHAPLARAHGTRYPVVQGPMTRVSDGAPFARAVADAGGLPFLAVAVMQPDEIRSVLEEARTTLRGASWGVGLLGFLPPDQLEAQLAVVEAFAPPFAIVAGGRPEQAARLEARGSTAYLHAPSPGLIELFVRHGARRFVLEGSECGGHTGPRTSFVLWDLAVDALIDAAGEDLGDVSLLFAGGVHDALSAAMVAAIAAPLVARGAKMGVLMGTAYLFTREIVRTRALRREFQRQAIACEETVLLSCGVGYTTRCAKTDVVDAFEAERRELIAQGRSDDDILLALERFNVGRLRLAAKGKARAPGGGAASGKSRYVRVGLDGQRKDGLYMLGDAAMLRRETVSIGDLHADVCEGSVRRLEAAAPTPARTSVHDEPSHDIAIIGMSCLLPGGADLRGYWRHIVEGRCAVREVDESRWRLADHFNADRQDPNGIYVRWGCFADDVLFDPTSYGIAPVSMRSVEPLQLLALEVSRRALEDARAGGTQIAPERTAVIFAAGGTSDLQDDYIFRTKLHGFVPQIEGISEEARQRIFEALERHYAPWTEDSFPGILMSVVAGRVANRLNLRGGNYTVDAACASSLAALDAAILRLRTHQADVVVVGGADGSNNACGFTAFARTQALSPRGMSRPFDESADGLVMGEGVAALILKRIEDAERDGDRIYAVIRGIGSSSDGRQRSLVAPHEDGQVAALERAYEDARFPAASVGLIEAHGTGTALGDPTEVAAIARVFGRGGGPDERCAIGSVKSSIGHTKCVSGLAGLIKGAMALHQRVLPPTLGVEVPNTRIDFATQPVYINAEARPWLRNPAGTPRRCGVSAFGFGGTNFHAVLEEYDGEGARRPADLSPRPGELLLLSGASRAALMAALSACLARIEHPTTLDVARFAAAHADAPAAAESPFRLAVFASSGGELRERLEKARGRLEADADPSAPGVYFGALPATVGRVAFLFPGQGSQRVNMMRDLLVTWPAWRDVLGLADEKLSVETGRRLSALLYPAPVFTDAARDEQEAALNRTDVAQPALGVVDLTALDVLAAFGVRPDVVGGHSFGEYVALCAAGVLSRTELLLLAEARGRLVSEATRDAPSGMASARAGEDEVRSALASAKRPVEIANLNAPDQTVLGGSLEAIDEAVGLLTQAGIQAVVIPVGAAFHTPAMEGAAVRLAAHLADVSFAAPTIPVYSNVLGARYPEEPAEIRGLLSAHIRRPVRFRAQIEAMYAEGVRTFIECGPGTVLTRLVGSILGAQPHAALSLEEPGRHGVEQLAHVLGALHARGAHVDPRPWFEGRFDGDPSLDAVLEDARRLARPPETAWRINMGKARPVGAPQSIAPASGPSAPARAAGPVMLRPRRVRPRSPVGPGASAHAAGGNGAAPHRAPLPRGDFRAGLLAAVSERTGYPPHMLRMDAHMEADLGIDSIKRMEILGAMTEFSRILDDPRGGAPLAEIARLRTLQSIVDWYERHAATTPPANDPARAGERREPAEILRYVVRPEASPAAARASGRGVAQGGLVLLVGEAPGLTSGLEMSLRAQGLRPRTVVPGRTARRISASRYEADLGCPVSLTSLRGLLHEGGGVVRAVVDLRGASEGLHARAADLSAELFLLLQAFQSDLRASRPALRGRVVVVTALGGRLAFAHESASAAVAAGVFGVAKSIAHEWPEVDFQCIDVDPGLDAPLLLAAVRGEVDGPGDEIEVGLTANGRWRLAVCEAPPVGDVPTGRGLSEGSVLLLTGGASGITAKVALALAERHRCTVVLVGRGALPGPESEATRVHESEQALRAHWLRAAEGRAAGPSAAIEADVRRILKARRLSEGLDALARTGARVEYHAVDVRDAAAFGALIDAVYERHGRIDGVVHGAGLIEDRPVGEKTLASFRAVFDTKVRSALVLSEKLRFADLRFLAFFSSVVGRFGNALQCDYSGANEVLNRLASHLRRRAPNARVVSIGWGPWAGGMVSDAHRRLYAARGVGLIPVEQGVALCLREIEGGGDAAEILIATDLEAFEATPRTRTAEALRP